MNNADLVVEYLAMRSHLSSIVFHGVEILTFRLGIDRQLFPTVTDKKRAF